MFGLKGSASPVFSLISGLSMVGAQGLDRVVADKG
jgi:hypothetical protein